MCQVVCPGANKGGSASAICGRLTQETARLTDYRQFHSDTDVLAAAAGPNPEITIVATDEVYRCAVVGHK